MDQTTLTHFDSTAQFGLLYSVSNPMSEKLYSLKEVAKILRVSDRSVFRYIHGGKLRATKIGYWRISDSDLKRFLAENSNTKQKIK